MTSYFAEFAWLGGGAAEERVLIEVADGRIATVTPGAEPGDAERLPGLTLPGFANAHSHAFQRALRGRVQRARGEPGSTAPTRRGSFWTWREDMYALAARLTPDTMFALARATYAEMALAGITCVGEFHYVHDGGNELGEALVAAAEAAGVRITLLDACYLAGGFGEPLGDAQRKFSDGDADAWAERVSALRAPRVGAAIHSVRAVPADQMDVVVGWARLNGAPLHFHLSEQPAENEACLAAHGVTPAGLLAGHGALGPRSTAVHATHLTDADVALLAETAVCMCPTTERDLADGIGRPSALAGPVCLGSDSHAVIDLLEEARAVEHGERLASGERGHWTAAELLAAATANGHAALGWPDAGRIEPGARADLVTIRLDSVRTAGAEPLLEAAVFAATAADVDSVVAGGRRIVAGGHHTLVEDVPAALAAAIARARETPAPC